MKKLIKNNSGTTLIEITLYFAIVGTILMSSLIFAIEMMNLTATSQNFAELQTNQDFIVQKITETIQEASSIDLGASVFNNPAGTLSLNMPNVFDSPTKFYFSDGDVFIQKANNSPVKLNANVVVFDSLKFTRLAGGKALDQVIIDGELSPLNTEVAATDQEFKFHLAVSLRK